MATLTNDTFTDNSGAYGGGLENDGTATVMDYTFTGNSATDAGGGLYNFGKATLTNDTFTDNSATDAGGGLANKALGAPTTTMTLTGDTFNGNSATSPGSTGGGLFNDPLFEGDV